MKYSLMWHFYVFTVCKDQTNSKDINTIKGPVAQLIANQIADLRYVSIIPARSLTFMAIMKYFLQSFFSPALIQEGLLSVTSESMWAK